MGDLYTSLMEWAMPWIEANWQLFLMAVGALFLLGGILNWKWIWNPEGHKPFGFAAWVYRNFGEKGARIHTSMVGGILIICAAVLWMLW